MEKTIESVQMLHNYILVTADRYTKEDVDADAKDNKGIYGRIKEGDIKPYQYVCNIGPNVRNINVGDCVSLNPVRYAVPLHQEQSLKNGVIGDAVIKTYRIPTVIINGEEYFKITDSDVDYIVYWKKESNSSITVPAQPKIILTNG